MESKIEGLRQRLATLHEQGYQDAFRGSQSVDLAKASSLERKWYLDGCKLGGMERKAREAAK